MLGESARHYAAEPITWLRPHGIQVLFRGGGFDIAGRNYFDPADTQDWNGAWRLSRTATGAVIDYFHTAKAAKAWAETHPSLTATESVPLSDATILQAIYDLGDVDYAAGFGRATTEELATHFGLDPAVMLRRMQHLARTGAVHRVRDVISRRGDRRVGWQRWEMYWDPAANPYASG